MQLDELTTHIEIRQALARYCRGIDRGDYDLICSAYHPGAIDHHGTFEGSVEEFARQNVAKFDRPGIIGQHHITNIYVELDGEVARVESYFMAFRPQVGQGSGEDELVPVGGRYLDRFERRAGQWRIAERQVVMDWYQQPMRGQQIAREDRKPLPGRREKDAAWSFFNRPRPAK